jgi:hypothetical protein
LSDKTDGVVLLDVDRGVLVADGPKAEYALLFDVSRGRAAILLSAVVNRLYMSAIGSLRFPE